METEFFNKLTIIIAVCAIIAPVITAIVNSFFQYRTRKMELNVQLMKDFKKIQYDTKLETYSQFLQAACTYYYGHNHANSLPSLNLAVQKVINICDSQTMKLILHFQREYYNMGKCTLDYEKLLSEIAQSFNRELSTLYPSKL